MIIRPIGEHDLEALVAIAEETGSGFTSLPCDRDFLRRKIQHSERTFRDPEGEGAGLYFFVLEDSQAQGPDNIAGCCAIEARVGLDSPFYHYRLGRLAHSSPALGLHRMLKTLFLSSDHTGDAEVCSLYLRPGWRGGQGKRSRLGTLLSRVRWLFIAAYRQRFPERVLAEMRGLTTDQGESPFWHGLGNRFLPMEFDQADQLIGMGDKGFIGELMPRFPIYLDFLAPEAQNAIGQVHQNTRPAIAMLKREGLRWEGYVDIFDGGPTMEAYIDDVKAVREARLVTVDIVDEPSPAEVERPSWLVSREGNPTGFRAGWVAQAPSAERIGLTPDEAHQLGVAAGSRVRVLAC